MIFTSTISPSLKIGLQFFGVWPDVSCAVVRRLLFLSSMLVMQYFQYMYVLAHCKFDEVQNLVDSLPITMYYTLGTIKWITIWTNLRILWEILAAIDTDWQECVKVDQHLHLMTKKASMSHFCSNALFGFYIFADSLYGISNAAITNVYLAEGDNYTSRSLPINVLLPFDTEQSPNYELVFVILFSHGMLHIYSATVINVLLVTLVLHISGQIDIICQEFKNISEKMPYYGSSGKTIKMLIERHHRVITFSENLNKCFSFLTLMQFFWNTVVICSLGLLIITSIHNGVIVGLVGTAFAYSGILTEIFIFCFAGEYLGLKSKSIADAVYSSLWYNMSPSQGKNLLFVIMTSQKQLGITAGGVMNLSLETFTNVMKASASYISVLNAMY